MVLHVILQDFRARQHFITLRTGKGFRLQMARHMHGHCAKFHQFCAATIDVAFDAVLLHIMLAQRLYSIKFFTIPENMQIKKINIVLRRRFTALSPSNSLECRTQITFQPIEI